MVIGFTTATSNYSGYIQFYIGIDLVMYVCHGDYCCYGNRPMDEMQIEFLTT